jgi:hypothetical protein
MRLAALLWVYPSRPRSASDVDADGVEEGDDAEAGGNARDRPGDGLLNRLLLEPADERKVRCVSARAEVDNDQQENGRTDVVE